MTAAVKYSVKKGTGVQLFDLDHSGCS